MPEIDNEQLILDIVEYFSGKISFESCISFSAKESIEKQNRQHNRMEINALIRFFNIIKTSRNFLTYICIKNQFVTNIYKLYQNYSYHKKQIINYFITNVKNSYIILVCLKKFKPS